jgi:hypothetical protein
MRLAAVSAPQVCNFMSESSSRSNMFRCHIERGHLWRFVGHHRSSVVVVVAVVASRSTTCRGGGGLGEMPCLVCSSPIDSAQRAIRWGVRCHRDADGGTYVGRRKEDLPDAGSKPDDGLHARTIRLSRDAAAAAAAADAPDGNTMHGFGSSPFICSPRPYSFDHLRRPHTIHRPSR